jgi:hypothetical protein
MNIWELHGSAALLERFALGSVSDEQKPNSGVVAKQVGHIEDRVKPVRHAMGADVGGDESAL